MATIKNILEKAESMRGKINPRYDISYQQTSELYHGSRNSFEAVSNAFCIGYMQGMKAAKAEIRKGGACHA